MDMLASLRELFGAPTMSEEDALARVRQAHRAESTLSDANETVAAAARDVATLRATVGERDAAIAELRGKLPRQVDPDVLSGKAENAADRLNLFADKGHVSQAQADVLAASVKDDPQAWLCPRAAGKATPFEAACKALEMNAGGITAGEKTGAQPQPVVRQVPGGAAPNGQPPAPPADPKATAEAEWDQTPAVRSGFSSRENYVNYRVAEMSGRIKVWAGNAATAPPVANA